MSDKKTQFNRPVHWVETKKEEPKQETVSCPVHHQEIAVKTDGGKKIAICTCNVPHNQFKGRVVWERSDTRRVL